MSGWLIKLMGKRKKNEFSNVVSCFIFRAFSIIIKVIKRFAGEKVIKGGNSNTGIAFYFHRSKTSVKKATVVLFSSLKNMLWIITVGGGNEGGNKIPA